MRLALACLLAAACSHAAPPPAPPPKPAPVVVAPVDPEPSAPSWLGVRFEHPSTRVIAVVPGSPAQKADLRIGDEVLAIDGRKVFRDAEAVETVRAHPHGVTPIGVKRNGRELAVPVTLEALPDLDELPKQTLLDKPAPLFAAQKIAGGYGTSLKELAGQVVVVDFWATWCGPCAFTMPYLARWQTSYEARGLRIVGLTSEDEPTVRGFLAAHPVSYAIARDADDKIGQAYYRFALPMLVVIDRTGVVRYVEIGAGDFDDVEAAITKLL